MTLIRCIGKRGGGKWFSFVKKQLILYQHSQNMLDCFIVMPVADESIVGKYYTLIDKGK